jgi:FkbM family methyltransferase
MRRILKIFKNRLQVFKGLVLSFIYFLLNQNLITFHLFLDYFFYFIFGTNFATNHIFKLNFISKFYNTKTYYDLGIFKLPFIDKSDLVRWSFYESIFFVIFRKIYFFDEDHFYERFGVEIFDGDIMIDAGANIGFVSAYGAYKGATVYAFEPIKETIKFLEKTIDLNKNLTGTIKLEKYALSNTNETMTFFINENFLMNSSSINYINENRDYIQNKEIVNAITLDEWVEKNNIKKIDFIKADIEGAERYMLLGAKKVLRDMKPKLSICTYHLPDDKEVLEKIVLEANPNYKIFHGKSIMYAK